MTTAPEGVLRETPRTGGETRLHKMIPENEQRYHDHVDPHRRSKSLSDIILGGQDGLVNVLGVLLGVAAAGGQRRIVLAAGLATAFAESISMAAVAYTSTLADADVYRSEQAREYRHVTEAPNLEREEIRELYARKGFSGETLDRVVDTITANKDVWVAVMMAEEHRLAPIAPHGALRAGLVVGASALVGSLIPTVPFTVFGLRAACWVSTAVTALALFLVGVYKAKTTIGHPLRSGLEMAMIGTASAVAGYAVGALFQTSPLP